MINISSARPFNCPILTCVLDVLWSYDKLQISLVQYLRNGIASFDNVVNTSTPSSPYGKGSPVSLSTISDKNDLPKHSSLFLARRKLLVKLLARLLRLTHKYSLLLHLKKFQYPSG